MAISTTDRELLKYVAQLKEAEKQSVLQLLKTFVDGRKQTFEPDTLEQYNQEIEAALAEVAAGQYITQEEMEKQAAKW